MDGSAEVAGGGGEGADEGGSLPREFSFRTTITNNGNLDWGPSSDEDYKGSRGDGGGGAAEQRAAGLTSAAPVSPSAAGTTGKDNNFAGPEGEPQFSFQSGLEQGINMTSPVLAQSQADTPGPGPRPGDLHRRASSIPETLRMKASLGHGAGEELAAPESDYSGRGGGGAADKAKRRWGSWSFRRSKNSEGGSHFLDEILGTARLKNKGNKQPRSPTPNEPSGESMGVSGEVSTIAADEDDDSGKDEPIQPLVSLKRVPSYRNGTGAASDPGPVRPISPTGSKRFEPARRRITILSMDGGGMRGLIAARCLAHLESLLQVKTGAPVKLCDYFDFLAGTSTGAILTLMITTPDENGNPLFGGDECCQFYAQNGRDIFRPRWYDPWRGSMRQLYRPKYSPKKFERLLKRYLVRNGKALTMRDLIRPVLVTSFDISRAVPHIFLSQSAKKDESRNFRLWEVGRGTASAPTYFRPAEVTSTDGKTTVTLIDGGAIQNNPALVAMTHVLGNNEGFPEAVGLQDLMILSLGAGQLDEKFELNKARKWGMAGWVRPLLNIMMDGSSDTIDYQLAAGFAGHKCPENYLRIQLSGLPNQTALMDCATKENIHDLIQFTDDLLEEKAVMRNEYGEKVTLNETYAERLSWFADQLIAQKKIRDQGGGGPNAHHAMQNGGMGMGPTTPVVSPLYGHLYMHYQVHGNGPGKPLETAKSVRF